jgi:hypothetical protein
MNVDEIRKAIQRVIKKHRKAFQVIGHSQTKLLELGAVTGLAEHYKSFGYQARVVNPKGKKSFVVKTSTRGFPWNFSRIVLEKDEVLCELHMNLVVMGAHDEGIYCVDVGIAIPGSVPTTKPDADWRCLPNAQLVTFAEVKKLVIYPMLLAQFIGIVHEIKPNFLSGRGGLTEVHPSPVLIVLGHYSGNSREIVSSYPKRNIHVTIAANYDGRLSRVRSGVAKSPFESDDAQL